MPVKFSKARRNVIIIGISLSMLSLILFGVLTQNTLIAVTSAIAWFIGVTSAFLSYWVHERNSDF